MAQVGFEPLPFMLTVDHRCLLCAYSFTFVESEEDGKYALISWQKQKYSEKSPRVSRMFSFSSNKSINWLAFSYAYNFMELIFAEAVAEVLETQNTSGFIFLFFLSWTQKQCT